MQFAKFDHQIIRIVTNDTAEMFPIPIHLKEMKALSLYIIHTVGRLSTANNMSLIYKISRVCDLYLTL